VARPLTVPSTPPWDSAEPKLTPVWPVPRTLSVLLPDWKSVMKPETVPLLPVFSVLKAPIVEPPETT